MKIEPHLRRGDITVPLSWPAPSPWHTAAEVVAAAREQGMEVDETAVTDDRITLAELDWLVMRLTGAVT